MSPTDTVEGRRAIRSEHVSEYAQDVTRPTRAKVVKAIRTEARAAGLTCNRKRADALYMMFRHAVTRIRRAEHTDVYVLSGHELGYLHPVLGVVMPDDVTEPNAGSAHDLINRHFIMGDEFAIVHTRSGANACVVAIATRNI